MRGLLNAAPLFTSLYESKFSYYLFNVWGFCLTALKYLCILYEYQIQSVAIIRTDGYIKQYGME